jgi:hypothetical protein
MRVRPRAAVATIAGIRRRGPPATALASSSIIIGTVAMK